MTARALLKNGSIMHYEKSGMSVLHGMELRGTEVTGDNLSKLILQASKDWAVACKKASGSMLQK